MSDTVYVTIREYRGVTLEKVQPIGVSMDEHRARAALREHLRRRFACPVVDTDYLPNDLIRRQHEDEWQMETVRMSRDGNMAVYGCEVFEIREFEVDGDLKWK